MQRALFEGVQQGVDRAATLRSLRLRGARALTPLQQGALRSVMTGSLRTQAKLCAADRLARHLYRVALRVVRLLRSE